MNVGSQNENRAFPTHAPVSPSTQTWLLEVPKPTPLDQGWRGVSALKQYALRPLTGAWLAEEEGIAAHHGRIVKLIGDGTLVEFGSAVDAVRCAIAIQSAANDGAGPSAIVLCIGVNLGDVIIEGDDI